MAAEKYREEIHNGTGERVRKENAKFCIDLSRYYSHHNLNNSQDRLFLVITRQDLFCQKCFECLIIKKYSLCRHIKNVHTIQITNKKLKDYSK
jgi:hypothetical protein